tara:strand:+ start:110 stop:682 length:573 start_codon:yes stop_codon:yes gene_type:complete
MPAFDRNLDVYQGFNFKKDKQDPVGFITKLTIGGKEIKADLDTCKDPTSPSDSIVSVMVLDSFGWMTGVTDPINFTGRISVANKQTIAEMLLGTLTNTEVKINFSLFEYDPKAKKYFKSGFPNEELSCLLGKSGSDLNIYLSDDPATEVQSPINYGFSIGITPQETEQSITLATGDQKNIVKSWGLTVKV